LKKYFSNYLFLVAIVVFSAILVSVPSVLAQEFDLLSDFAVGLPDYDKIESFSHLASMVDEHETIRVIVGLDIPFVATGIIDDEQLVKFQMDAIRFAQIALLEIISELEISEEISELEISEKFTPTNFRYIPYIGLTVDAEALELMRELPLVISIVEDIAVFPTLKDSMPVIGANKVWDDGFKGQGQTIAVLDTGVDRNHDMLSGKVVEEACYSTSGSGVESLCPNGQDEQLGVGAAAPCDTICQHGTHVASTAAGNEIPSGPVFKYAGVARDADIIGIQVFSKVTSQSQCNPYVAPCVKSYLSDILEGLERVVDLRNTYDIAAVNLSLGGGHFTSPCDFQPYKQAIDELRSYGIPTIIASGNSYHSNGIASPACISSAISVGATDNDDVIQDFSNSAYFLDLLAPGTGIRAAIPGTTNLGFKSGTSMATPHVAGAWAVLKSNSPNATIDEILNVLKDNAVTVTDSRNSLDFKRIDLDASLCALDPATCAIPPIVTVPDTPTNLVVTAGNGQVSLSWSAPSDDGGSSITDYKIEYNDGNGWQTFADGTSPDTTATVTGLTNGISYDFRVSAINSAGTGPASQIATATPATTTVTTPGTPTGLTATSSQNAKVPLFWTAPSSNGGSVITDYKIEYKTTASTTWISFSHPPSAATSATVTGLANEQSYDFRVSAINNVGMSTPSNISTAIPGGCLIATAAYGTELAPQVQFLREIRDNTVMSTASGTSFMTGFNAVYYSFAPTVANWEKENPMFQEVVRVFITPMIYSLSIMSLADSGSEVEVLGLGISVIALNLGMYIAAPAIVVWQVRKRI